MVIGCWGGQSASSEGSRSHVFGFVIVSPMLSAPAGARDGSWMRAAVCGSRFQLSVSSVMLFGEIHCEGAARSLLDDRHFDRPFLEGPRPSCNRPGQVGKVAESTGLVEPLRPLTIDHPDLVPWEGVLRS